MEAAVRVAVGEIVGLEACLEVEETLSVLLLPRPRVAAREVRRALLWVWTGGGGGARGLGPLELGSKLRGFVGEGERWRILSGKTERKAGSRRGVVAVEMREGFLRRR